MIKRNYYADVGSIALMHKKTNVKVYISNFYGDGSYDYYILNSEEELPVKTARELEVWVDKPNEWKIMDYDCCNNLSDDGYEIEEEVWGIRILRYKTTFYFILRKGDLL